MGLAGCAGQGSRAATPAPQPTRAMVTWAERTGRTDLLDQEYIARRSRHNLGVAVDLTLVDLATGKE
ncbi:MAG TPA: hypothetical protein VE091_04770, partial [Gemmatimonadales bacterium]|nr:hypothetical protein [Gemmatimonadales bacterium]